MTNIECQRPLTSKTLYAFWGKKPSLPMKKPYNRYKFFLKNWTLNQSTLKTSFWFIRDSENRRTCSVTPRGCSQQNLDCGKLCRTNRVCLSVTKLCLDSLQPHGLQHARLPCHSVSPGVCSDSCPLSQWCHPTISSSVTPFSCPRSFPSSGSFPMSWLLASGGQSIGASASTSVLPMNLQGFPYHGYTSYFVKGSAPMLTGHLDQPCQDSCSHTHPSFLCAWLNFHGTHHQTNHLYLTTCSWELPRWYWW